MVIVLKEIGTYVSDKRRTEICNGSLQFFDLLKRKKMQDDVYDCILKCDTPYILGGPRCQFASDLVLTKYLLAHQQMCLAVDEITSSILQHRGGHITGRKYCCEMGGFPQIKSSSNIQALDLSWIHCSHRQTCSVCKKINGENGIKLEQKYDLINCKRIKNVKLPFEKN